MQKEDRRMLLGDANWLWDRLAEVGRTACKGQWCVGSLCSVQQEEWLMGMARRPWFDLILTQLYLYIFKDMRNCRFSGDTYLLSSCTRFGILVLKCFKEMLKSRFGQLRSPDTVNWVWSGSSARIMQMGWPCTCSCACTLTDKILPSLWVQHHMQLKT